VKPGRLASLLPMIVLVCSACTGGGTSDAEPRPPETTTTTPTLEELANLTYYDIVAEPVELKDGRWEGTSYTPDGASRPVVELLSDLHVFGDLNGDGIDDAAALLAENSGGSGTRIWVAAIGAPLGQVTNFGSALVGDRSQIRAMSMSGTGWIHLEVVEAGPDDAACCPTQLWTKEWALVEGQLKQVSALQEGTLSADVFGSGEWTMTHLSLGEAAPDQIPLTVQFEESRVVGSSGCNRYFADFVARDPGAIVFGDIGTTRRACPEEIMDVELRFQHQLRATTGYGFLLGKLALNWQDEGRSGTMLFAALPGD